MLKKVFALLAISSMLVTGCGEDKPVDTGQQNVAPRRSNVDADTSDIETLEEPAVEQKAVEPALEKIAERLEQRPPRNLGESSAEVQPSVQNKSVLFDGSKYGLNDMTPSEQKEADTFMRHGNTEEEVYETLMMGRELRGGLPKGGTEKQIAPGSPLQTDDLMFGAITLGDTYDYVVGRMGEPRSKETTQYGTLLCTYSSMQIGFKDNKVVVMITPGDVRNGSFGLQTLRGISSLHYMRHVADAYGPNFNRTVEDDPDVFEYKIMSKDNRPALLRFAFVRQADPKRVQNADGSGMVRINAKSVGQIRYINVRYE